MKNWCKNWCFLMARNHVWRYTLRLFHTFAIFENNRKINEKRDPESRAFGFKNEPWTRRVRLRAPFFLIFRDSQNRWFFNVTRERPKIHKNQALERQRGATGLRPAHDGTSFGVGSPRAAPRAYYQNINTGITKKKVWKYRFYKNRL